MDGTRQAARQRALPCTPDLPPTQRRLDEVCAPGYLGRKRGELVRTRTTVLQAHRHQWVGSFSGAGNGDYRGELRRAVSVISAYMKAQLVPLLWKDWPRCGIRRAWLKVVRSQTVWVESSTRPEPSPVPPPAEGVLTRAERAHWRLSWDQRLARNSRPSDAPRLTVTLHGLPATFAHSFGLALLATA